MTSVALGTMKGQPVVVSGGADGTVRVWELASGAPRGKPLRADEYGVSSVALGARLEGRTMIVSGTHRGSLSLLDLTSSVPRRRTLQCHIGWVNSVALGLQGAVR